MLLLSLWVNTKHFLPCHKFVFKCQDLLSLIRYEKVAVLNKLLFDRKFYHCRHRIFSSSWVFGHMWLTLGMVTKKARDVWKLGKSYINYIVSAMVKHCVLNMTDTGNNIYMCLKLSLVYLLLFFQEKALSVCLSSVWWNLPLGQFSLTIWISTASGWMIYDSSCQSFLRILFSLKEQSGKTARNGQCKVVLLSEVISSTNLFWIINYILKAPASSTLRWKPF